MELDLHIHTNRYSGCSNIKPHEAVKKAIDAGLHGIAFTEHGIRWPDREIDELREACEDERFIIIAGQEAACYSSRGRFQGEFLVFGYDKSLGSNKDAETLIELVHDSGGVVIAAHPFKPLDNGKGFYGCGFDVRLYDLDGLEIEHPSYDGTARETARSIMKEMAIAGTGSSDSHDLASIGTYRTHFINDIKNEEDLCREIRSGNCEARSAVRSPVA